MDNDFLRIQDDVCTDMAHGLANNESEKKAIDSILLDNPMRITPYLKKLIVKYDSIRKQFLPSPLEAETHGTATPFEEGKKTSPIYGLERLYRDRVLLTPHFDCPAYCRFCYKKSRVMRNRKSMTLADIDLAVAEVGKMQDVRGALITGGDPFMDKNKLFYLLDKLMTLENIKEIRIGTRMLLNSPHVFTDELCDKLASYIRPNFNDASKSKYLAINVHFNHPDELQPEVLEACHKLTSRGITLRNQTVLLKGINDDTKTMKHLFHLLLRNNIIVYYMNHCMPVAGSDHLRTTVQKGLDIYKDLCTESSCSIPHYVYAPSGGKVHVGPDTTFDYSNENGLNLVKVKLLYKAAEFRAIAKKELPPRHSETEDGFIEGYYIDGTDN
ncbi:MAG: radical SAM protein [Bacteroidales bacterium]|nr:MAG: radical SAM protein [Bacteroidales bacterium]